MYQCCPRCHTSLGNKLLVVHTPLNAKVAVLVVLTCPSADPGTMPAALMLPRTSMAKHSSAHLQLCAGSA